ncbi:peptide chain release factor N(5)-glutamine methyltransferase [Alteromonas oceanisediminis]|uniref:peptide chain release factor N(5)-glutamine methyltransferase n=1 Tax=Alteromonas oceanisediminis TaxID=2836180 RepID=UPI001BDA3E94|nr:peptide chain release factor N(5)-glutamine methyltransferase [Alteromonas oceanisediminis]MBT0587322.1 peptide chain release factor N(5)-glutamine methyltransferase [Alteromonas oceanisediminis]
MNIAQALTCARDALRKSASDSVHIDARVLLKTVLQCDDVMLFTHPEIELDQTQQEQLNAMLAQRVAGVPIAHLTGQQAFWDFSVAVNASTLIPRPETELLVEAALKVMTADSGHACDLGTGTGVIALALAKERPHWQVVGVDKAPDAIALAKDNKHALALSNVEFTQSEWFSALQQRQFDCIVSNPPYVEENSPYLAQGDVRFEPRSALTSGQDGLDDIRKIVDTACNHLACGGWLMVEHGNLQGDAVRDLYAKANFGHVSTLKDIQGHPRVTIGRWQITGA